MSSKKLTLNQRIENALQIDNNLSMKNAKVDIAAAPVRTNSVLTFTPVDEELLKAYKEQYDIPIERTDPITGEVKRMKYFMPESEPELEPVPELPNINYEAILNDTTRLGNEINQQENLLKDLYNSKANIISKINEGKLKKNKGNRQIKQIDKNIVEITELIANNKNIYDNNLDNIRKIEQDYQQLERQRSEIIQSNKEKADTYARQIDSLNKGSFNIERMPNESDQDYMTRFHNLASVESPKEDIEAMKNINAKKLREKFREILLKDTDVELVTNSFNDEDKLSLLKVWDKYKTDFIAMFGLKNRVIKANDVITFTKNFLDTIKGKVYRNEYEKVVDENYKTDSWFNYLSQPQTESKPRKQRIKSPKAKQLLQRTPKVINSWVKLKPDMDKYNVKKSDFDSFREAKSYILNMSKQPESVIEEGGEEETKGHGISNEKFPQFIPFGEIKINPNSLYYKNKLVVRAFNTLNPLDGFPPNSVSNKFVELIMAMLRGHNPSTDDIHQLSEKESGLFDRLLTRAKLHRKFTTKNPRNANIDALKKRLALIEGEYKAGNNNPLLKKDLKNVLYALKDYEAITIPQIKKYMKEMYFL